MADKCTLGQILGVDALREKFGSRVKVLRKEAGFSQEDFAHRCGFARSYMSRIERGTSNLSLDGIERLAVALDIPVEKLFINL